MILFVTHTYILSKGYHNDNLKEAGKSYLGIVVILDQMISSNGTISAFQMCISECHRTSRVFRKVCGDYGMLSRRSSRATIQAHSCPCQRLSIEVM